MPIRHARTQLPALVAALATAAALALNTLPAAASDREPDAAHAAHGDHADHNHAGFGAAADAPISQDSVRVPMIFPVVGGASYSDTYGACRGTNCSRVHLGQDLMAPKMRPLVAVFSGTISYVKRESRVGEGNYFSLTGASGWTVNYIHVNNDSPGTDDGRGTADWSLMPGLRAGSRVFAGQQLGWQGDSGNAEGTSPHTHFELRKGDAWGGTVYNPYRSLRAATVLNAPYVSGPHPDGTLISAPDLGFWVIRDGQKRRILSSQLETHGYTARRVIKVTSAELRYYPTGGWALLPDGLVVRGPEGDRWVIGNGERIAVPNAAALTRLGTTAEQVVPVDAAAIARIPQAADQTVPGVVRPGALLVDSETGSKWYVEDGTRRQIATTATMRSWTWTLAKMTSVSSETLSDIPVGAPVKLRDGTVFTSPSGNWYVVSRGQRRPVASAIARKAYGWSTWPKIEATPFATSLLPMGASLP